MGDDSHSIFSNGGTALVIHAKADDMMSRSGGKCGRPHRLRRDYEVGDALTLSRQIFCSAEIWFIRSSHVQAADRLKPREKFTGFSQFKNQHLTNRKFLLYSRFV